MKTVRLKAAATLVVGLMAVAGCGGSSTKSTASTSASPRSTVPDAPTPEPHQQPAPANAAFIAQADAVCGEANAVREKLRTANASSSQEFVETAVSQRNEYEKLAKLSYPSSITSDWRRVLADEKTLAAAATAIASYAQANRMHNAERYFVAVGHAEHDMVPILRRDGFGNCTHFH